MKEYDVFIPLFYNDGTEIEATKFQRLHKQLLEQFDGLTYFPQTNEGFWKFGDITYRDEIVIYRVISGDAVAARRFFKTFKEELKAELRQLEILIVERDVDLL